MGVYGIGVLEKKFTTGVIIPVILTTFGIDYIYLEKYNLEFLVTIIYRLGNQIV